jgi:hypothetical protein
MTSTNTTTDIRALAVVDWSLDPQDVAVALHAHAGAQTVRFGLLVPARLRGLQWIGDPTASRPCAELQLREVARHLRESGLDVAAERIGDPERVPAINEALSGWAADEIVLLDRPGRRRSHWAFGLERRIIRASGLPVRSIAVQAAGKRGVGLPWVGRAPRCTRATLQAV